MNGKEKWVDKFGFREIRTYIYSIIKKLNNMKTVMEQLMEIQDQVDSMKMHLMNTESFKAQSTEFTPCCDDACGCKDQVTLTNRTVVERAFTEEQVVAITTELANRIVIACKEAVENACFDDDSLVNLELNYNNQIEINLNDDSIKEVFKSEIDDFVNIDTDSIADEVSSIIEHLDIRS